jgi:hypothetical protein
VTVTLRVTVTDDVREPLPACSGTEKRVTVTDDERGRCEACLARTNRHGVLRRGKRVTVTLRVTVTKRRSG